MFFAHAKFHAFIIKWTIFLLVSLTIAFRFQRSAMFLPWPLIEIMLKHDFILIHTRLSNVYLIRGQSKLHFISKRFIRNKYAGWYIIWHTASDAPGVLSANKQREVTFSTSWTYTYSLQWYTWENKKKQHVFSGFLTSREHLLNVTK